MDESVLPAQTKKQKLTLLLKVNFILKLDKSLSVSLLSFWRREWYKLGFAHKSGKFMVTTMDLLTRVDIWCVGRSAWSGWLRLRRWSSSVKNVTHLGQIQSVINRSLEYLKWTSEFKGNESMYMILDLVSRMAGFVLNWFLVFEGHAYWWGTRALYRTCNV